MRLVRGVLSSRCLSRVLGLLLVVLSVCAYGQTAVMPDTPEIVGYVHFSDPNALSNRVAGDMASAEFEVQAVQLRALLGNSLSDPKLGLVSRGEPLTLVWVRSGEGGASMVVVLPSVNDTFYLNECARQTGRQATTVEGMSLMGSADGIAKATALVESIKKLRAAVHPTPIACYFSGSVWEQQSAWILCALAGVDLKEFFARVSAPGEAASGPSKSASRLSELATPYRLAGMFAKEVTSAQILVDFDSSQMRVVMNLTAKEGSPLARLCNQPAASPNTLVRYLPSGGRLRACVSVDGSGPAAFAKEEVARAAQEGIIKADRLKQWLSLADEMLLFEAPAAIYMPSLDGAGYLSIVSTRQPDSAVESMQRILQLPMFMGGAGGAVRGATTAGPLPVPAKPGVASPAVAGGLEVDKSREHEGLQLFRFVRPGGSEAAWACFADAFMFFSPDKQEFIGALDRCLRLTSLGDPLEAQKVFADGANVYADVRLADDEACGWASVSARMKENRLQVAANVPYGALRCFAPAKPTPVPTEEPTPTPTPEGGGGQ